MKQKDGVGHIKEFIAFLKKKKIFCFLVTSQPCHNVLLSSQLQV